MARIAATAATAVVGATVFTSRTGRVARTVTALEDQPNYPDAGPVVYAQRSGKMECGFALSELWVEAPAALPTKRVADLVDGDMFSVDGGITWHRCFAPLWGDVSCYLPGSLTMNYRVNAEREDVVLIHP